MYSSYFYIEHPQVRLDGLEKKSTEDGPTARDPTH